MVRKYRLYQVDSFTKDKFTGNPAGVITNAEGLSDNDMQRIARELNNSETAFVFPSNDKSYDVHIRFFTPMREVPVCGHATIAAHYVRAIEEKLGSCRIVHKTGAGILPVDIIEENGDYKIIMTQGRIEFGNLIEGGNRETLLSALKIKEKDLSDKCPVQIVSTGHSKVMAGIRDKDILDNLKPNYDILSRLSGIINCNGYYVFTIGSGYDENLINGRMFAPAIGINEDPVTGNANGPLAAYLVHHKIVECKGDTFSFYAKQGEAIGRTGIIGVEVEVENGEPVKVMISGKAVIVFQTELTV